MDASSLSDMVEQCPSGVAGGKWDNGGMTEWVRNGNATETHFGEKVRTTARQHMVGTKSNRT